jgi:hypothetical protein
VIPITIDTRDQDAARRSGICHAAPVAYNRSVTLESVKVGTFSTVGPVNAAFCPGQQ